SEISRAAVALLLAMARYGNDNALEALKSLAKEWNIFAIQAIQYLITDNGRSDLVKFLVDLASQWNDKEKPNPVVEALGSLVQSLLERMKNPTLSQAEKDSIKKIIEGVIETLTEIANKAKIEARARTDAVTKLWVIADWAFKYNYMDLVELVIKALKKIGNDDNNPVKDLAKFYLDDLEKRKNNSDSSSPTPTPKPSTNNTTNNPPSGTGPAFNLSGSTDSRNGRSSESRSDDNNKPSQRNSPDSLSQYLRNNIFNHPSLRSPLQRLNKSKKASSKLKERFKNVNKKLGQKSKILAKGLREKLKKQGLSEEEIEAKVKEFLQKLAEGDEEAKKYLEELGLAKEEIEKDFQDAEGFFSAEDQERYLKENFGIEAEEAKEIMNMTDEQAQIDFLKNEGFSESTAKLIVNPKLVEKELDAFFKLVEELEDKLGLEDNPEAREKIADLLMEALLSEEITLDNFAELIEDPESFGEKVTRLELLLRELWKKIESRSLSAFSPFLN
ncbi:MAG: hypothetical protein NC920_02745, partial [Candidatus Omnitrophica bacterium]|nr:hypothetical protein [Candidatus Omnitrophota bacterium]